MKTLGGIGAIILGVVAILVSVGLQTIWAPPAVFDATTETTQEAPLTVITDGVDIDPDEAIEYTVRGDGEFSLMYGQLRDIEAWVGEAAHHRIDGVNTDVERGADPTVNITYVDGEAEVPNPVNSDLWLATQEVTDEVTQRWTRTDAGQWGLLIAVDGVAPAPTDFSVSWVNIEPNSPLILPLMIAGIVLVLIGIALLIWRFMDFRRRAKRTSGRRAVVRGDYTGLTAADVMAGSEPTTQTLSVEHIDAGEPVAHPDNDQATEVVAGLPITEGDQVADEDELAVRDDQTATPPGLETPNDDEQPDDETSDGANLDDEDRDDGDRDDDPGSGSSTPDEDTRTENLPLLEEHPEGRDEQDETKDNGGFLRRTVTALSAVGLAIGLGVGPAHAASETPEDEDISDQVDQEQLEDEVDPEEPDTFPVVVDAQFEQILEAVATTARQGDEALDADVLAGRVAGHALRSRQDSYRNNTIEEDYPRRTPVAADEILATWMDRDDSFPRTIYAVTSDAEGSATQLLVLRQEDARSQYQLIQNAPFAPGAELPSGSLMDHNVENMPNDESTELVMSPEAAVEALAEYLTDPEADAADQIADNEWIDMVHEHQADLEATHSENDIDASVTRTLFDDSITSVRLPNGSALVFGTMNSLESLTPQEDGATVDLTDLVQEVGEFASSSHEGEVRIRYREQFALVIPAEGEVSLAGYETVLSTVD
ncbi:DUF202 domain-containing protein [Enteractinococcus coprophilus]|uniref:DUF202 domain-containing protein n=1 Tax=Enteractinococcus coprophilus TaxID=1027633 RepID=UPI0011530018|nr:DUF202 domain-containing protein [Enteractinococcus coprophilus]